MKSNNLKNFTINLQKSLDKTKKKCYYIKLQGGDNIKTLINIFFISLIINFFISIYTIYIFLEIKVFHHKQGSKLEIKKQILSDEDQKQN